jgi:hypothetical protein
MSNTGLDGGADLKAVHDNNGGADLRAAYSRGVL